MKKCNSMEMLVTIVVETGAIAMNEVAGLSEKNESPDEDSNIYITNVNINYREKDRSEYIPFQDRSPYSF